MGWPTHSQKQCGKRKVRKISISALALTSCAALGGYFHSLNNCKFRVQFSPKGNQPSIFTGRTDAETPILWPSEKILMLVKTEGRKRRERQRMRWLDSIIDSMDMNFSKLQEIVEDREALHAAVHGVAKSWT